MASVLRRLGVFLLTLVAASIAVFALMAVLPGDPAQINAGTTATPEQVAALRQEYGLDAPATTRYFRWVGDLATGRLGDTFIGRRSIVDEITNCLVVTLPLVAMSMVIALLIALPLGFLSAVGHRRWYGTAISAATQIGIAIPAFWMGVILVAWFSVRWQLLPSGSFVHWSDSVWGAFKSLLLPAIALGIVQAAILTRYVRSSVLDVLREDYIRTARAKGMTMAQALRRHGARNAAVPVVTVLGLNLSALLVGAVVIENVFAIKGLGKLLVDNINNREVILIMDVVMLLTVITLVINLVVDLLLLAIDPRTREVGR
jgi:peptide/nickel transport system permease protein